MSVGYFVEALISVFFKMARRRHVNSRYEQEDYVSWFTTKYPVIVERIVSHWNSTRNAVLLV